MICLVSTIKVRRRRLTTRTHGSSSPQNSECYSFLRAYQREASDALQQFWYVLIWVHTGHSHAEDSKCASAAVRLLYPENPKAWSSLVSAEFAAADIAACHARFTKCFSSPVNAAHAPGCLIPPALIAIHGTLHAGATACRTIYISAAPMYVSYFSLHHRIDVAHILGLFTVRVTTVWPVVGDLRPLGTSGCMGC